MNVGTQHHRSETYAARVTSDPDTAGPRAIGFDLRATQRPPTGEYGALSQEVLNLHSRSLGVLGATLALATVVVWRWFASVQASNDSQAHLLALFLAAVVATAMAVTYKLYEKVFRIGAYTFGGARDVWNTGKVSLAVGGDLTFYSKPAILDRLYGDNPVSWKIFVRLRPAKMDMSAHGTHGQHGAGATSSSNP